MRANLTMLIIYIHASRKGCDHDEEQNLSVHRFHPAPTRGATALREVSMQFTSAHLVRGATLPGIRHSIIIRHVYIHAPCERCDD